MNGHTSRALRRASYASTETLPADKRRAAYRGLKRVWKFTPHNERSAFLSRLRQIAGIPNTLTRAAQKRLDAVIAAKKEV